MAVRTDRPGTAGSLAAAAYVFAVVMMGTTLPTPLYPLFQERFGFGGLTTTVLFAVYAGGVIATLILFGRLSDALGRRPVLLAAVLAAFGSAICFLVGEANGWLWLLFCGRILSGLAAGVFTATGTVAVLENAPPGHNRLGSAVATAANIGGLGLGIATSGLVAQWASAPLRTPFLLHAVLLVLGGFALLAVRERVTGDRSRFRLQRPRIPAEARGVFGPASLGAFLGFAVSGMHSAVTPNFMTQVLHQHAPALIAAVVSLLFLTSAVAQIVLRRHSDRTLLILGAITLAVSMAVLIGALLGASLPVLLLATALSGVGQGLLFMTGLRAVTTVTEPARRTEATTSYFIIAYIAISLPVVAVGVLANLLGLIPAGVIFAVAIGVPALLGLRSIHRFR